MPAYIVVNKDGLNVRSQPSTSSRLTVLRHMSQGEAFNAIEIFNVGNETWARLTNNPTRSNEYCCITYANREPFAIPAEAQPAPTTWAEAIDQWARAQGFQGPRP